MTPDEDDVTAATAAIDRLSPAKRALFEQSRLGHGPRKGGLAPVRRRTADSPARLSFAQGQLWYFNRLAPENPVYNESVNIRKQGSFDHQAFVRAFNEVVRRHEAWRTTFVLAGGEPVQIVGEPHVFELPVLDLSGSPLEVAEREAASLAVTDALAPYDVAAGPLMRPRLVKLADDQHILYLALHHLIFDGVSLYRIVLPELVALYDAFLAGRPSPLPEPAIRYGDYAEWEREWMEGPPAAARLAHWRHHLEGVPALDLPLDHPRPMTQFFRGHLQSFRIPAESADALRSLATSLRVTFFQVLAACYAVMLYRYTGQDDVAFGTPSDLRQRPELQSVVGMCLTPLVLRCNLAGDPTFADVVHQMRSEVIDALSNAVPFLSVVRELQPERDPRMNSLFQALLTLEPEMIAPDPLWSLHQMGGDLGTSKFDLSIELDQRPGGHVDGRVIVNADVFEPDTARRMVGHLLTLLESVARDPEQPVSVLGLLTGDEQRRQLVEWNATEADQPAAATVPELVTQQALRTPDAIALEYEGRTMTYAELEGAAEGVAQRLREAGVRRGDVVALHVHRGTEAPVGMLGIMKAGAAYLPLDTNLPPARLAFILGDAGASVMLCQPDLMEDAPRPETGEIALVPLDLSDSVAAPAPAASAPAASAPAGPAPGERAGNESPSSDDLAYVLYTSGSTGAPKGVRIRHSSVVNLLSSLAREPGLTEADTVLTVSSFSFDASVPDLWLPLSVGARLVVAPTSALADGPRLATMIEGAGVTYLWATATTWQLLIEAGWSGKQDLVALNGGEPIGADLAEAVLKRSSQLWNTYGPTETTVTSTMDRVDEGQPIRIGRPIANTKAYVLDRFGHPVPVGVSGELFISGAGVAAGYVNRPEETTDRFSDDPFHPGARMYRTGDLVRQLPDGRLQHLRRLDDQIKLRGYRIELGEIESTLRSYPEVASAAVALIDDASPAGARLVAYVVPTESMPPQTELRRRLRSSLPEYMVPSAFVQLTELPRSPNGKLDRRLLPAPPALARPQGDGRPGEPDVSRTPLEDQLLGIWRDTLGVEDVGLDDDFFDLGGHSLLAVRLVVETGKHLGMDVPLSFLYEHGATVRAMATVIEEARESEGVTASSPGRPGSTASKLFFVVPWEPTLVALRHLRPALAPEHAVVGLLAGRHGELFDRATGIEDRAATLMESITRLQDEGPYLIAGSSFGGLVAYEIATLLQETGQEVKWLGLVNTYAPAKAARPSSMPVKVARALVRPRASVAALGERVPLLSSAGNRTDVGEGFDGRGAFAVGLAYEPRPNGLPLDLFVSERDAIAHGRTLGWNRSHSGPLRIHIMPGDHLVFFDSRNAPTLARKIRQSLDELR